MILAAALLAALASPAPVASSPPAFVTQPAAPTPAPTPTHDPLAYDDPGMHFRAPEGWRQVQLPSVPDDSSDKRPPSAIFVYHGGQMDQRSIVIDIQSFDGTLETFESSKESEFRNADSGTFIDHRIKTTLANGMPAYFIAVTQSGGEVGHQLKRYDYLIYDLTRSIDVSYVGRYGDFSESDAKAALADLSVVVYPRRRN